MASQADDSVFELEHIAEAQALLAEKLLRLAKFGLLLRPDKWGLIEFERFAIEDRERKDE